MYYNEHYGNRTNRIKRVIGIIILIIGLIGIGFGGYFLVNKVILGNVSYEHLSELVEEKEYKENGKVIEKYSYIEIPEKDLNIIALKDWCMNYATPNIKKFDKFIIKYKGDKDNKGIVLIVDNYIHVDCKIIEDKNGKITYEYLDDEYSVVFGKNTITKYTYEDNKLIYSDWDTSKNDWGKPIKIKN